MEESWIYALVGGGLVGLSATIHLLANGRVTGISGIFYGLLKPVKSEYLWRLLFTVGLLIGGVVAASFLENPFVNESGRPLGAIIVAGVLVGFGTKLGSGCTSGHGVCGISRLSPRSMVATITFMLSGMIVVRVFAALLGGQ